MSRPSSQSNASKSSDEFLQELAYAVAHDLGASARTIKGFADLLTRRYAETLDADGQKFLRLMSKGATDLQAQLAGLLEYSRVESRGQPFLPTDACEVWSSVTTSAAARLCESTATVEQGQLPIVLADAKQLTQLLTELLENSLKFRGDKPLRVRLSAEPSDVTRTESRSFAVFRFSDNGRGIAAQHLERVFQMFQRCCTDTPGVGAGLAVAQRIVQRHGGVIWAESTLDVGTSICFTMPSVEKS